MITHNKLLIYKLYKWRIPGLNGINQLIFISLKCISAVGVWCTAVGDYHQGGCAVQQHRSKVSIDALETGRPTEQARTLQRCPVSNHHVLATIFDSGVWVCMCACVCMHMCLSINYQLWTQVESKDRKIWILYPGYVFFDQFVLYLLFICVYAYASACVHFNLIWHMLNCNLTSVNMNFLGHLCWHILDNQHCDQGKDERLLTNNVMEGRMQLRI